LIIKGFLQGARRRPAGVRARPKTGLPCPPRRPARARRSERAWSGEAAIVTAAGQKIGAWMALFIPSAAESAQVYIRKASSFKDGKRGFPFSSLRASHGPSCLPGGFVDRAQLFLPVICSVSLRRPWFFRRSPCVGESQARRLTVIGPDGHGHAILPMCQNHQ
jgi:hypothetical protein